MCNKLPTVRVVAAVILKCGKILATQRGYGEFKGLWEFPGGKLEPGESPEAALVREIREELKAVVEVGELITTVEYDYPRFHLSMDCFWCRLESGSGIELTEHEAARWLGVDELESVEWLPADVEVVERIREIRGIKERDSV